MNFLETKKSSVSRLYFYINETEFAACIHTSSDPTLTQFFYSATNATAIIIQSETYKRINLSEIAPIYMQFA